MPQKVTVYINFTMVCAQMQPCLNLLDPFERLQIFRSTLSTAQHSFWVHLRNGILFGTLEFWKALHDIIIYRYLYIWFCKRIRFNYLSLISQIHGVNVKIQSYIFNIWYWRKYLLNLYIFIYIYIFNCDWKRAKKNYITSDLNFIFQIG